MVWRVLLLGAFSLFPGSGLSLNCGIPVAEQAKTATLPAVKYIHHPDFERPDADERFAVFAMPEVNDSTSLVRLSEDEEALWFLRYNYLKFGAEKIRMQILEVNDSSALYLEFHSRMSRASQVRQFLQMVNQGLIGSMAKRFVTSTLLFEDLFSEGELKLLDAIENFNVAFGWKFSTYASNCLFRNFLRLKDSHLKRHGREKVFGLSGMADPSCFQDAPAREGSDFGDDSRALAIKRAVERLFETLDEREQAILSMRYGLFDQPAMTLKEVGRVLDISKERVRQIESRAIVTLGTKAAELHIEFPE